MTLTVDGIDYTEHPVYVGYYVSKCGQVFSKVKRGNRLRKQHLNRSGYYRVTLKCGDDRVTAFVHRLVAETYIENPLHLPEVNHIDEDKTNNNVGNLEWCDRQYNSEYSLAKKYRVQNVATNEIIEVFNLRKWCDNNGVKYKGLLYTLKAVKNRPVDGYKLLPID